MPKKIDYPHAPIDRSIELAEAVYSLGRTSSMDMCAEQMGLKVGGGFKSIVSAATKFGLITKIRGQLSTTALFESYHLGYSTEEKSQILRDAFLNVPLFLEIYERFKDQELPVKIFDKLLIREFKVNQLDASRVAKYFISGAKVTELLNSDNTFHALNQATHNLEHNNDSNSNSPEQNNEPDIQTETSSNNTQSSPKEAVSSDEFSVQISGPGINSTIIIREDEDLDIVEVMLKKVRKKLLEPSE